MLSEPKVTKINYMTDDFCKEFVGQQEKYTVKATTHKQRNKPNRMNDAEYTSSPVSSKSDWMLTLANRLVNLG